MHNDPITSVLFALMVVIFAGKLGAHFATRAGQPGVLGELVIGMVLGNLHLLGINALDFMNVDYLAHREIDLADSLHLAGVTIDHLARLGVILLLFRVGLESSVGQLRRVGGSALTVAVVGVIVPTALGWLSGAVLLPGHHWAVHMFVGATLSATSVGITARALQDLGKTTTTEAQIILGAAVIDDVLGLVVLAVAQGVIAALSAEALGGSASFGVGDVTVILAKAVAFLGFALVLGQALSRRLFRLASLLRGSGMLVATSLLLCFGFALAANFVGLAPIVGAFAAGLVLDEVHYQDMRSPHESRPLEELLLPLTELIVPVFFVIMGMHVDLASFANLEVLYLAGVLIVAAVVGKQVCGLGVLTKDVDRRTVGIGMIPRGEVGLIFAAIGLQLRIGSERVIDEGVYSAIVLMVVATTMVTPPLLKWSFDAAAASKAKAR